MGLKLNTTVFGTKIRITQSGEEGVITGFCQHQRDKQKMFNVEYTAGDGRFTGAWFYEDQLTVV